jgi:hypothetical protein
MVLTGKTSVQRSWTEYAKMSVSCAHAAGQFAWAVSCVINRPYVLNASRDINGSGDTSIGLSLLHIWI